MEETRYYEIRTSFGPGGTCICWGLSRFGVKHDAEMQNAVMARKTIGDGTCFSVGFTPAARRIKSPEAVNAQRIRNLRKRVERYPLFADDIMEKELEKPYYTMDSAVQDQQERLDVDDKYMKEWWAEHTNENRVVLNDKHIKPKM